MRIIFKKACVFNRHKRVVGNITTVKNEIANDLIEKGIAIEYKGEYPPKAKTKVNLKDLWQKVPAK